jgi:electron transfer flavoprotein alpha subunit
MVPTCLTARETGASFSKDKFVAPATSRFKNVMPRVAALLDVMQVSEIIKVISPDTFERPIYAGRHPGNRGKFLSRTAFLKLKSAQRGSNVERA